MEGSPCFVLSDEDFCWESPAVFRQKVRALLKYWYQMQLYMMGLHLERGLITCVDADTMELYHELVPYDEGEAMKMLQRATRIVQATDAGELLPRAELTPAAMACRMCRVAKLCWGA